MINYESYLLHVLRYYILSILGCKNDTPNLVEVPTLESFNIVHINPQKSTSLKTGNFVHSVQFVPFETIKESEFSNIAQIECLNDRYIILDENTSQILFFTKTGKFLSKISPDSDELPIPYKHVVGFTIDHHNKKLYFNDLHSRNIFEFDLDGNFLQVYPKEEMDYHIRENHHINEYQISYFSYKSFPLNGESPHNIIIFKDGVVTHAYLPFDATIINRNDVYGSNSYFFESGDMLFFTKPYSEYIYCFDSSGEMFRAFQFKFPDRLSIPEDFTSNSKYRNKRKRFVKNDGHKIYLITDFFQSGNNLIFRIVRGNYSNQFLYDLSNKSLVSLTKYVSDSSTHFLPILGNKTFGMDNGKILSVLSSKQFIDMVNKQSKYGVDKYTLPKNIKEIYDQGNDQNPILLLTTFKKEISYDTTY